MKTVRVDEHVRVELLRRRLPGERSDTLVIRRALREQALEDRLRRVGLGLAEMAELAELRSARGVS